MGTSGAGFNKITSELGHERGCHLRTSGVVDANEQNGKSVQSSLSVRLYVGSHVTETAQGNRHSCRLPWACFGSRIRLRLWVFLLLLGSRQLAQLFLEEVIRHGDVADVRDECGSVFEEELEEGRYLGSFL